MLLILEWQTKQFTESANALLANKPKPVKVPKQLEPIPMPSLERFGVSPEEFALKHASYEATLGLNDVLLHQPDLAEPFTSKQSFQPSCMNNPRGSSDTLKPFYPLTPSTSHTIGSLELYTPPRKASEPVSIHSRPLFDFFRDFKLLYDREQWQHTQCFDEMAKIATAPNAKAVGQLTLSETMRMMLHFIHHMQQESLFDTSDCCVIYQFKLDRPVLLDQQDDQQSLVRKGSLLNRQLKQVEFFDCQDWLSQLEKNTWLKVKAYSGHLRRQVLASGLEAKPLIQLASFGFFGQAVYPHSKLGQDSPFKSCLDLGQEEPLWEPLEQEWDVDMCHSWLNTQVVYSPWACLLHTLVYEWNALFNDDYTKSK